MLLSQMGLSLLNLVTRLIELLRIMPSTNCLSRAGEQCLPQVCFVLIHSPSRRSKIRVLHLLIACTIPYAELLARYLLQVALVIR